MTSRARKLTVGVAVVMIAVVVVLLVVTRERDPGIPITLTFVRYDYDKNASVIRITNHSGGGVAYEATHGSIVSDFGQVKAHGALEVSVATTNPSAARFKVTCFRVPSTFQRNVIRLRYVFGIERSLIVRYETNLDLPPPKTTLP